jgi:hypothetical protein
LASLSLSLLHSPQPLEPTRLGVLASFVNAMRNPVASSFALLYAQSID